MLEPVEAALLSQLAGQVAGILTESDPDDAQRNRALARLLPDAYADDPDASAEFRRFTSGDLTDRKVRNARVVIEDVADAMIADGATEVRLDPQATQAWLRSLTDIRLVLATRLGIQTDGDLPRDTDEAMMLGDVYDWLGWVQESLVSALDG
jgi:cytochrome P450